MGFPLVPKSVTLNDLEWHNDRVFCVISPNSVAVAARGCLPLEANVFIAAPTPAIRSPLDILMVTTIALV